MSKRNYFILLVLALIFAAPGITAYLYFLNPQWLTAAATNKGNLLSPPVLIVDLAVQAKPKWRFVYWYPESCEKACLQEADKLARVRLALGRHLYEVDEWLVLAEQNQQESLPKTLKEKDIHILALSKASLESLPILGDKPRIFIASPSGHLVLTYGDEAKPQDIFHDIKQLLSTTEKKSG